MWRIALCGVASACMLQPEPWLRDLALEHQALRGPLREASGYDFSKLYEGLDYGEQTEFWSGTLTDVEGYAEVTGSVVFLRKYDPFNRITWSLDLAYDGLRVDGTQVDGTGTLTLVERIFESRLERHDYTGVISVAGRTFDVVYEAHLAGPTLNRVEGRVGDDRVDWENPNPDLP